MTGVQLRYACWELMEEQGYPEPTGRAKITWGCNLPVWYVLHTVWGPYEKCLGLPSICHPHPRLAIIGTDP